MLKKSQVSDNPHSKWAQAGFLIVKKLNIRFGKIDPHFNDPPLPTKDENNNNK